MIKWFTYIVLILLFAPCLSSAKIKSKRISYSHEYVARLLFFDAMQSDTTLSKNGKHQQEPKIKEVAKAKRQTKPEKVDDSANPAATKIKPKRQRRPEGMERPPEIPRRSDGG